MKKNEIIIEAINEKLGKDVIEINMVDNSPFFDSFIVCTAANTRNQEAICDEVIKKIIENGFDFKKIEGKNTDWLLVDAFDIIVHIFLPEARENLRLEQLWKNVQALNID